ncbi:Zinc finger BED domain-containing protein 5 [Eumeta japonica]|uniref:Zinc finger BED domain-containing protein 5 n=1 Tax=Eumeta variegata TaxID=151549 RepID=A0A4C1XY69_EUMVA|nr:Zinc finger BED domain-containing protein 5 [Eumeta japonica]
MALNILLPFPTTYLCDTGFSTCAATKTKYRNRLDAEPDMRLQLSSVKPDINQMMKTKNRFRQVFCFPKGSIAKNVSRSPRLHVATSQGLLYVYALDAAEGGECALLKQHQFLDPAELQRQRPRSDDKGTLSAPCCPSPSRPVSPQQAAARPAAGDVARGWRAARQPHAFTS